MVPALLCQPPGPMFVCGILGTRASSLWPCYITASSPSVGSASQPAGAEAGTQREVSPAPETAQISDSASPLPTIRRGREFNQQSASSAFSQQGPLVLSLSHVSTAPVSGHTLDLASQGRPKRQPLGCSGTPTLLCPGRGQGQTSAGDPP